MHRIEDAKNAAVQVTGLPATPVEWIAAAPRHASRLGSAALQEGSIDLGSIELMPARGGTVVVLDDEEQPVEGARVIARGSGVAETSGTGIARFENLPAADVDVSVIASGFLESRATLGRESEVVKVVLNRGAAIRAALVQTSDGKPPAEVDVRVTNAGTELLQTLSADPELLVSALHPGATRLRITSSNSLPYDTGMLEVRGGEVLDLGVLTLEPGFAVRGTLTSEAGRPIGGARIRALRLDGDMPALADVLGNWVQGISADDGSFRLSGLSAGAQLLVAEAEGFAQTVVRGVSVSEELREADAGAITLSKGCELELLCKPVRRCGTEAALLIAGAEFPFLRLNGSIQDGRATLHAVPPGDFLLRLSRGQQVVHERLLRVEAKSRVEKAEITLPSVRVRGQVLLGGRLARGGTLRVDRSIHSSGVPLLVRQQTASGSTLGSEWAGGFGASTTAQVGQQGRFEVEDLEPGDYSIVYRGEDASTSPLDVTINDLEDQVVDLSFDVHEADGIVVDEEERPVAAQLEVTDSAGRRHRADSGLDGRFHLLGLSAGRATIRASARRGSATMEFDAGDRSSADLIVHLTESGEEAFVLVEDATGRPAAGALVFAIARRLVVVSADEQGRAKLTDSAGGIAPVAAHQPGGPWAFGSVSADSPARLRFPQAPGTLIVTSSKPARITSIAAPGGFPLDQALPMAGAPLQIGSVSPLQVPGLQPGNYVVSIAGQQRSVNVTSGGVSKIEFD